MADDPRLSFLSPTFDARLVLEAPRAHIKLLAQVHPLDNLSRCRALLPEDDPNYAIAKKSTKVHARAPEIQKFYDKEKEIKKSNIFLEIAEEQKEGPFSVLHACLTSSSSHRIRVITRGLKTIRGQFVGTLLGYDKHMNLILQDAAEEYCEEENGPMLFRQHGHVFIKGDGIVLVTPIPDES